MLFGDMTAAELERVEKIGHLRRLPAESTIIEEGRNGSSFFLIVSGRVEVRKNMGEGRYKKIVELGSGDVFGEIAFLGVKGRTASVVAQAETEVMEFERDELEELIASDPVIGVKCYRGLAGELARRLARSDDEIKGTIVWALGLLRRQPEAEVMVGDRPKLAIRVG